MRAVLYTRDYYCCHCDAHDIVHVNDCGARLCWCRRRRAHEYSSSACACMSHLNSAACFALLVSRKISHDSLLDRAQRSTPDGPHFTLCCYSSSQLLLRVYNYSLMALRLAEVLHELGISYALPPQPVQLQGGAPGPAGGGLASLLNPMAAPPASFRSTRAQVSLVTVHALVFRAALHRAKVFAAARPHCNWAQACRSAIRSHPNKAFM
jgi:hypothetical protein